MGKPASARRGAEPRQPAVAQAAPPIRPLTRLQWAATVCLGLLLAIAPLKLGSSLNVSGVAFFPLGWAEWVFANWPPCAMPVLTGACLLLTIAASPPRLDVLQRLPHLWLPFVGLVAASLIGLIATTEIDVAVGFAWHTLGVLLGVLAVILHLAAVPRARQILLVCILAGAMLSALSGWQQVLYGFDDTKKMLQEMAVQGQGSVDPAILDRINQGRAFASFTYPNNFAAHLLLTTPLVLFLMWSWGARVTPPRPSQAVLAGAAAVLMLGAFGLTRSRAAIIALGLAAAVTAAACGLRYRAWLRRHWPLLAVTALAVAGGLFVLYDQLQGGRTGSSLTARLDYYRSAWLMFLERPLTGVGMGEFFPWHLRLKPPGAEETRITHNLFLHFLGQAGIGGGLAAGYFLLQPTLLWYRACRRRLAFASPGLWVAVYLGWMSWAIHSLADFNLQIPGSLLTAAVLPALAVELPAGDEPARSTGWRLALAALALLGIANVWRFPGEYAYQEYCNRLGQQSLYTLAADARVAGALSPWSPYAYDWLGKMALKNQQYQQAADAFAEAVRRTPHRAAYHAFLAEALLGLGRLDEARREADLALVWYPHKGAYIELKAKLDELARAQEPPHAP